MKILLRKWEGPYTGGTASSLYLHSRDNGLGGLKGLCDSFFRFSRHVTVGGGLVADNAAVIMGNFSIGLERKGRKIGSGHIP